MNSGSSRDDLLFLLAAGQLDEAERDEVETWLAAQPGAAALVARAEHEVASLAAATPPVAPSPAVRERLLARAGATAPTVRRSWIPAALAAGLAGLAVSGGIGWASHRAAQQSAARLHAELDATRAELSETTRAHDALDAEIADLEARTRALESDLVLANKTILVLRAEDAESLPLAGTPLAAGARGRVFWDWGTWYCYLHAVGLAHDPQKTYAIWLFTEDGVVGVGTFHADSTGEATFLGPVPHDVGHVLRAGVSVEPDEDLGSQPRGEIVMLGEANPERS